MDNKSKLTISIVLYNTNRVELDTVLSCVLANENIVQTIYLIDNSPNDKYRILEKRSPKIRYIHNANLGYGEAHNLAMSEALNEDSDFHLVLNPDIIFDANVLPSLCKYMEENSDVVYMLPKVTYPNGELQYLCKLLPTPSDLIFRRFIPSVSIFKKWKEKKDSKYCLMESGYNKIINPPCLSGCFMFLRLSALQQNNIFFDDNFFMYFEDFDLIRRLHRIGKTIFYPEVSIIHNHAKSSYKNKKMLKEHIKSAIKYFNKYGWFLDKERKKMNKKILKELITPPLCLNNYYYQKHLFGVFSCSVNRGGKTCIA